MKRFTETCKWDDPFFMELPAKHKILWMYLCDKCDNAGVIHLSYKLASFLIGSDVTDDDILSFVDAGRIEVMANGKLLLTGFVRFQFGKLSEQSNLHKSVIALQEQHKLKGSCTHQEPMPMGPSKGKGNRKGIVKVKVLVEKKPYGELGKVMLTDEEYQKVISKQGEVRALAGIERLDSWLAGGKKKDSHYACLKSDSWVWERVDEAKGANSAYPSIIPEE